MYNFLTYRLEENDEGKDIIPDSIFKWLSVIYGFKFKKIYEGNADIYYGNNPCISKITIVSSPDDTLWDDLIQNRVRLSNNIIFDIINAITNFISDKVNENAPLDNYDSHCRLKFENTFQAVNRVAGIPVVNL